MPRTGYRKKPAYIYWISLFYFLVPFLTLLQFSLKVNFDPLLLKEFAFSDYYLSELILSFSAAAAVLSVTRVGFVYLILLNLSTLGVKIYNLQSRVLFEYPIDFVVVLFLFTMTILFLFTAVRAPFLNPDMRWWKQPPRYSVLMPGVLIVNGLEFPVVTLNISHEGMALKLDEEKWMASEHSEERLAAYPKNLGNVVELKIRVVSEAVSLFNDPLFKTPAQVVWCPAKDSPLTYGLGLKFLFADSKSRQQIKSYLKLLKVLHLELIQR